MGLDMYLLGRKWIGDEDKQSSIATLAGLPHDAKVREVVVDVGYWRKANQIHSWFVQNVQGGVDECQLSYVSREKLEELLGIVEAVLADHSKAEELLEPRSGFFFGSTDIDEYYFEDLENTRDILKDALSDKFKDCDLYYQSSW